MASSSPASGSATTTTTSSSSTLAGRSGSSVTTTTTSTSAAAVEAAAPPATATSSATTATSSATTATSSTPATSSTTATSTTQPLLPWGRQQLEDEAAQSLIYLRQLMEGTGGESSSDVAMAASHFGGGSPHLTAQEMGDLLSHPPGGEAEVAAAAAADDGDAGGESPVAPPWPVESLESAADSSEDQWLPRRPRRRRKQQRPSQEEQERSTTSGSGGLPARKGPLATTVSWSWDHFNLPEGGTVSYSPIVECKHCGRQVKRGNPGEGPDRRSLGTSSLLTHLRNRHKEVYAAHLAAHPTGHSSSGAADVQPGGARGKVPAPASSRKQPRRRQPQPPPAAPPAAAAPPPPAAAAAAAPAAAATAPAAAPPAFIFPPPQSLYVPPPSNSAQVQLYFGVNLVCRACSKLVSCGETVTEARHGSIMGHYENHHPELVAALLAPTDPLAGPSHSGDSSSSARGSAGGSSSDTGEERESDAGPSQPPEAE